MSSLLRLALFGILVSAVLGCGPGSTPVPENTTPPAELIRKDLQYIVDSGQVGSEMMTIQSNITRIGEEDPDKAAKLQEDYNQLEKARGNQARSIAKKMMEKL
ncbi:hypothetical protein C5Y96_22345 [Blastopirellula marina]|uniref:Uncharacterized protein n=1 Tax=Blastopirellula marina TaxID=124 RepID=A0A2S8F211_9BACT|nr:MULTISPECIES: hypothetical protein [Pirellulaceae]PQO26183.1 hypothetical protein C5Y96_22345 [Blastopirellula marina]RCS44542.1 hypothetical protein DTL36_22395 [Bremerella cremea]